MLAGISLDLDDRSTVCVQLHYTFFTGVLYTSILLISVHIWYMYMYV